MGVKERIKQGLTKIENRRYEKMLARRKITYAEWYDAREREWADAPENGGKRAMGEECRFSVFLAGEGRMAESALQRIGRYFEAHPEAKLLYGDEDVWGQNGAEAPWFKPDWSPDLFRDCFYFGSLVAVRDELSEKMPPDQAGAGVLERIGGPEGVVCYRATDLAAYERWIDRCVLAAGGYQKGGRAFVGHINGILFHAESRAEQRRFLQDLGHLRRRQELIGKFREEAEKEKSRMSVSVIVPSKDNPTVLEKCLRAVERAAEGLFLEILVVDNGSGQENRERISALIGGFTDSGIRGTYLYRPMEFNFSRMCNLGAAEAKGKLLLFLNDDVELTQPGCLWELAAFADRDYAGAVGLKLLYPDSGLIQHDGIVNLPLGPVHKLQFQDDNNSYYYGRNRFDANCVAVTGACLAVSAEKFREAGGFRESLGVAYNDVELCFGLMLLGYHNMVDNHCSARHHESLSRGGDETPEKRRRLEEEREQLYRLHPDFCGYDPYYPPGLERRMLDGRIVPAYVSAGNRMQEGGWKPCPYRLERLRRDDCVMVRLEMTGPEFLQGYCVVLGDNNACYERYLILLPEKGGESPVFLRAEGQYRQDLEENLPDQRNVALCGFWVSRQGENLRPGNYRVAAMAVNRVTGEKLWNESGRSLRCTGSGM